MSHCHPKRRRVKHGRRLGCIAILVCYVEETVPGEVRAAATSQRYASAISCFILEMTSRYSGMVAPRICVA